MIIKHYDLSNIYLLAFYHCMKENSLYYVYVVKCDDTFLKFITKSNWNFKVKVLMKDLSDFYYVDNNEDEILCFEHTRNEWYLF